MKKTYIVVADPYNPNLPPFNTARKTYSLEDAVAAAKSLSRDKRRDFYVAKLVLKTEIIDVQISDIPTEE